MDEVLRNRWGVRLFFTGTALFFGCFVAYILTHPGPSGAVRPESRGPAEAPASSFGAGDTVTLPLGESVAVGSARFTYRGKDGGVIRLAVVVGGLDGEYAYERSLSPEEARAGFRSAGRRFRLVSAGRSRLRLRLLR